MYRGAPVTQLDGSYYQNSNCVVAVTKKLMDMWTLGYWNPLVKALRVASGDTSGGVSFDGAELAASKLSQGEVQLKHLYWAPSQTMRDMLAAGKEFGVIILCSVTRYTPYRTGTYTGSHLVCVVARRIYTWTDSAGVKHSQEQGLVMDPGHSTPSWKWWPWSLLVKAAMANGDNKGVHLLYGRDRTAVNRVARAKGAIRSATKVVDSPSNVVGSFEAGQTVYIADTADGSSYVMDNRTLTGWNKLGPGKFAVAKIR